MVEQLESYRGAVTGAARTLPGETGGVRLFVAAWPTDRVHAALAAMAQAPLGSVRWERPQNWHVTLSFLGSVHDHELGPLVAALAPLAVVPPVVAVAGPATETLGRGVLCLPVAGLDSVAEAVREATGAFNRSPDRDRPFVGHLTLARTRRGRAIPRRLVGLPFEASWPVEEVRLVLSTTGSGGSRYETVSSVRLTGSGPGPAEGDW